jgi:hypothetical protein
MPDYHYPGDDGLPNGPLNWWTRWRLRAPQWPFLLAAMLFGAYYFWRYRTPSVAMVGGSYIKDFFPAALSFGLLAVIRGVQVLLRYSAELEYRTPHQFLRFRSWCLPWLFLIAAVIYFAIGDNWPMRVSFWWSRSALDHLADKALADPDNASQLAGKRAGVYRIAGAEVIGSTVVLYLDNDKGSYAFVRVPGTLPNKIQNQNAYGGLEYQQSSDFPKNGTHDDRVGERIGDDWFVMYSWYWLVKVGWS